MITKTRNILAFILLFIMGLSIFGFFNPAHANTNVDKHTPKSNGTQVKMDNKSVPKEVEDLAKKNFLSHVSTLDKAYHKQKTSYSLGEPFKIYKLNKTSDGNFYYPVIDQDGTVKYIVTISPNLSNKHNSHSTKNYSINVSPFISNALNDYKNQKVTIFTSPKGYFIIGQDNTPKLILKTPREDDKSKGNIKKETAIRYSDNFKKSSKISKPITKYETAINAQPQYVNTLRHMQIRETQGNNGWCAGYTMSFLLNATYNTNHYYAEMVMRALHPNLSGRDFQFSGLTPQEMMKYGQSQGRNVKFLDRMPQFNEVDWLTKHNKGTAILSASVEPRNGLHAGHAMAVAGNAILNNNERVILIWNPWDNGLTTQSADNNVIPVSDGTHFRWNSSIYGY
ncbi:C47 family peptidase [Staphylococcus warneri]|uniref:C47 family peptidase n=1 Tax=Staphylococcus warneri TaxID=1292 RepID=UPI0034D140C1